MSHSRSLAQVLLACAVLLKVDDATAGHAAHLHRHTWAHLCMAWPTLDVGLLLLGAAPGLAALPICCSC